MGRFSNFTVYVTPLPSAGTVAVMEPLTLPSIAAFLKKGVSGRVAVYSTSVGLPVTIGASEATTLPMMADESTARIPWVRIVTVG